MINFKEHIIELDGVEYIPLKIAETAIAETYEYKKYENKLNEALIGLKEAMAEIDDITEDLENND